MGERIQELPISYTPRTKAAGQKIRWFDAPDHVRIGIAGPTDRLEEGLRRVGAALDTLRSAR